MDGTQRQPAHRCSRCGCYPRLIAPASAITYHIRSDHRRGWLCERCQPDRETLVQLAQLLADVRRLFKQMERKHRGTGLCQSCHCAVELCDSCYTCERCHRPTSCAVLQAAAQLPAVGGV